MSNSSFVSKPSPDLNPQKYEPPSLDDPWLSDGLNEYYGAPTNPPWASSTLPHDPAFNTNFELLNPTAHSSGGNPLILMSDDGPVSTMFGGAASAKRGDIRQARARRRRQPLRQPLLRPIRRWSARSAGLRSISSGTQASAARRPASSRPRSPPRPNIRRCSPTPKRSPSTSAMARSVEIRINSGDLAESLSTGPMRPTRRCARRCLAMPVPPATRR